MSVIPPPSPRIPALLALADGRLFRGTAAGVISDTPVTGEVVFNTSMCGYQEILTDPSYCGQIVTMTYPHQGNYGTNDEDVESAKPRLSALIVRELERLPSNFRSTLGLDDYLIHHGIAAIEGIDTRALTRHIRDHGAQIGAIVSGDAVNNPDQAIAAARATPSLVGRDLVQTVTCETAYRWQFPGSVEAAQYRVVAYDFGIKFNILRQLAAHGCDVTVVPASTPASEVLAMSPDGVFLSNGPGDPEPVTYAIDNIRALLGGVPVFGICLGHQLLCLANGAKSFKMRFGHHGGNQPVQDVATGKVEITAQNHGFAVDPGSLPDSLEVTHINLNDQTVEGVQHRQAAAFSVQYHPEAAPGPGDSAYLFSRFTQMMDSGRRAT